MSKVLQFPVGRQAPVSPEGTSSGHLPGVDAGLRRNPGAIGGDHLADMKPVEGDPERTESMRRMLDIRCGGCGHEWKAPNVGNCPRCRSQEVTALTEQRCVLPRV